MLNAKAFANAVTVVTAAFYIVCVVLSYIAPDLLFNIGQSWVHSLNLDVLKTATSISPISTLWSLVTISAITWVTTYATIMLYNKWHKK